METNEVKNYLINFQSRVCDMLQSEDPTGHITKDSWNRPNGGGGLSCVFNGGSVFEQGGVNFSHVHGNDLPPSASAINNRIAGSKFEAMGVSIVIHPFNPFVPTTHANIRLFTVYPNNAAPVWWFGGGFDLTPYYGFQEDAVHFHQMAHDACAPFGPHLYPKFKKEADDYFFLKHRNEPRGIGGIFFDDFNEGGFDNAFAFLRSVGDHFIKAYQPIVNRRKNTPYTQKERDFQLYRRGRYVEFNLVYDRGTVFGLQSGARTESILMSLPPNVRWQYNWSPEKGSKEAELYDVYLKPRDWIPSKSS